MSLAADVSRVALTAAVCTGVVVGVSLSIWTYVAPTPPKRRERFSSRSGPRVFYDDDDGDLSSGSESDGPKNRRSKRDKRRSSGTQPKPVVAETAEVSHAGWQGFSMEEALEHANAQHQVAAARSPQDVLVQLQKGNARFWSGTAKRPASSAFDRRALITKQFPSVAILGCSDSRVPTEIVFDMGLGDMFTVRVAGNCLNTATLASLQYAVHHLKVKVLIVLGHEGCGAVKAAGRSDEDNDKEPECLAALLRSVKKCLDNDRLKHIHDARAHDREAVVTNVGAQLAKLGDDLGLMEKVRSEELIIIGGFYEISSGICDFFFEVKDKHPVGGPIQEESEASDKEGRVNEIHPGITPGVSSQLLVCPPCKLTRQTSPNHKKQIDNPNKLTRTETELSFMMERQISLQSVFNT